MRTLTVVPLRRVLTALFLLLLPAGWALARAAVLTSSDGKTREFPVVVSAGRQGLTVRESAGGKDIVIPWARLDARLSADANPWLEDARSKAVAGETVVLNIGLPAPAADPLPAAPAPKEAEWRTVKTTVPGGPGKNFTSLALSAYVHREVAVPRLAVVWVGSSSPLAKRGDAADLARRLQGALVVADFQGAYTSAEEGSGEALVAGVAELLKQARTGKEAQAVKEVKEVKEAKEVQDEDEDGGGGGIRARPAIIVMGSEEAATFVWSLVCTRPADVVAAITLNGGHKAESTAGAFATPCLFLESPGSGEVTAAAAADLTRPQALWRHYSTDGCRWCYAAPAGDPLALAVAFAREVAAASPYVEALELLESWENNKLRHRIPMPVATAKSFKEDGFRLATPDGGSVFPVKSKVGAARNDLVWVPSAAFAARLAGK
jgi:hypothetical protein